MTEENKTGTEGAAQENQQVKFNLQRIYLKDLSYEAPLGAKAFQKQWKPKVNQDLSTKINRLDDTHFEVVLSLTITVKDDEDTIYLVEIQQAGIFLVEGLQGQQLTAILNTHCPQILFPYARETVDSVVTRGSFPALLLPPVNFDALFQQAVAQAQSQSPQDEESGGATH
jgi:preprotein translocase subunit SecB